MGVNVNMESMEGNAFERALKHYEGNAVGSNEGSKEWKDMTESVIGVKGKIDNYNAVLSAEFDDKLDQLTNNKRPSKDEYYLGIAEAVSKRSNCLRLHYGSVIVNNDRIISTGYNGAPRKVKSCMERGECYRIKNNIPHFSSYDKCFSVHSEQNALIHGNYEDMIGGTLYLVGIKPDGTYNENTDCCDICKRMIRNAQISRVVMATGPNTYKIAYPQTDWFQFKDEE